MHLLRALKCVRSTALRAQLEHQADPEEDENESLNRIIEIDKRYVVL